VILALLGSLSATFASDAASGRVVKVLPLLLDLKGRDAVSPSLYDRDAYQVYLRQHTNEIFRHFVSTFVESVERQRRKIENCALNSVVLARRFAAPNHAGTIPSRPDFSAAGLR